MGRFQYFCFIIQCIDAELIKEEYVINIFTFLNSVFQNCPEK